MLVYYSRTADTDFWREHWGAHHLGELLAVARASPLTPLIERALPAGGVVLEAGCGLGQYVVLLRERGRRALGVDAAVEPLVACRREAGVPLAASDLRALALRDGSVSAYVSLGVVEHDPDGPDAILAEARRVLAPDGALVLSVPYVNGARRLGAPWLRRRARRTAAAGGTFYQYAFTRGELMAALARHAFTPQWARPYDPARLLRAGVPPALLGRGRRPPATAGPRVAGRPPGVPGADGRAVGGALVRLIRRALYTETSLRLLGHMLLVAARRA